jgi:hypothetical protein
MALRSWAGFTRATVLAAVWLFGTAAGAASPVNVQITLEGCRNDGTITFPALGPFICPDAAYTSGNLGKGWNELDLVPHRLTADAGDNAPASQTYTIAVALDREDVARPGYDVLSAPTLNATLSDAACQAPVVGAQTPLTPGIGGTDTTIYRLVTITQSSGTECVYDFYGRLALGSHLYPGASLHANALNENLGTAGIGARDVSIPVKEIAPQELDKTMTARQDADHGWSLRKGAAPATIPFGDVCSPDTPTSKEVTFTVTWTKSLASPGTVKIETNIFATNPAARLVTVNVTDVIYEGLAQTVALDTASTPPAGVDVPANTQNFLVLTHTYYHATTSNLVDAWFNDVATATYTDKATGIAIPGQTTATAQAQVTAGNVSDGTAAVRDVESMTGTGLQFSVAAPSVGAFVGYIAGTKTVGPVKWGSGLVSSSGSVDFVKTIHLDGKIVTSGTITDSANLIETTSGTTTSVGPITVNIQSSATGTLTIEKSIPDVLEAGESIDITFRVTGTLGYSNDVVMTFVAGGPTTKTLAIAGLVPDTYSVDELANAKWFYPAGCLAQADPTLCRVPLPLAPLEGSPQPVDMTVNGGVPVCAAKVTFTNRISQLDFADARVQKRTAPELAPDDPDYQWTFTLRDPDGAVLAVKVAGANAGYVDFGVPLTLEGIYTVTEALKTGWEQQGVAPVVPGEDTKVCSFEVDYPEAIGTTFQCTFRNVKKGKADVVKTVGDPPLPPAGDQVFTFQLRSGASATSTGTILEAKNATAANGGIIAFATLLSPGNTVYQLCEIVMPGWTTTLGPPLYAVYNPGGDNSVVCTDFTVAAGETKSFAIRNIPPPGGLARTIGFWRNWTSCAKSSGKQDPVLDETVNGATVAIGNVVMTDTNPDPAIASFCVTAVRLLSKQDIATGQQKSSDPAFNLAAQLLAAKLNILAGAGWCPAAIAAIDAAQDLLDGPPPTYAVSFTGTGSYPKTGTFATTANSLAKTLDKYNNNTLCQ